MAVEAVYLVLTARVVHAAHRLTLVCIHLTVHPIESCSKILFDSELLGPKDTKLLSLLSMATLFWQILTDMRCISLHSSDGSRIYQMGTQTPGEGAKTYYLARFLPNTP